MKQPPYLWIGISVALAFWLFESSVHVIFSGEPRFEWIPSSMHELWMRCAITFLIVILGLYAQRTTSRLLCAEHEKLELQEELNKALQQRLELQERRTAETKDTVLRMYDILNNFLNNLSLFKSEAMESDSMSQETLQLFDDLVQKAAANVRDIGEEAVAKAAEDAVDSN